jgi:hypothetical protein
VKTDWQAVKQRTEAMRLWKLYRAELAKKKPR